MLRMLGGLCYQCNLEKYECLNCENQFIVGMEMRMRRRNSGELWCPYCRSENVDRLAYTDDDRLQELDLGRLSLVRDSALYRRMLREMNL